MSSCALLIDANNCRGEMGFPPLSSFFQAATQWAASNSDQFVLIAVDHGPEAACFCLRDNLAIAFAGPFSDAYTIIVHAVDWLLSSEVAGRVTVVSNDRLLLRRCRFGLPKLAEDVSWYQSRGLCAPSNPEFDARGDKRDEWQRSRLIFQSSKEFGHVLSRIQADGPDENDEVAWVSGIWWNMICSKLFRSNASSTSSFEESRWATYRTRRGKGGKVLSRLRSRRRRASQRENSADRVRMASQLHHLVSTQALHSSGNVAGDGVASINLCASHRFRHWFTTDVKLRACTKAALHSTSTCGNVQQLWQLPGPATLRGPQAGMLVFLLSIAAIAWVSLITSWA